MTGWKAVLLRLGFIDWRTILICAAVAAVAVVGIYFQTSHRFRDMPSELTMVNRSSRTITSARMKQTGSELTLKKIEPGESRSVDFASREGPLTLAVTFNSGHSLSSQKVGYLAPGLPVTVTFDVTDDKVSLRNIVRRKSNPQSYKNH